MEGLVQVCPTAVWPCFVPRFETRPRRGDEDMVTSWPTLAARVTAAGLQSGMTSKSRQWWRASLPDPEMSRFLQYVDGWMKLLIV